MLPVPGECTVKSTALTAMVKLWENLKGQWTVKERRIPRGMQLSHCTEMVTTTDDFSDVPRPDEFSGLAVSLFEHHRVFADKFLGIVRLKFNTQKLGEDTIDSWFALSNTTSTTGKKKAVPLGELHLKVVFGDGVVSTWHFRSFFMACFFSL